MGKKLKKKAVYDSNGAIIGYEAPQKGITIKVCEKKEADKLIIAYNYSHKVTKNSFLSFLVYYNGKVAGAM